MIFLLLFFEFFKTGLFTIGGALAAIPFLQEMADNTGWFSRSQLADMIAVAESTPGPIGINMATFSGFTTAGVLGGIIASLGIIAPSIVITQIIARLLVRFSESRLVKSVFFGLRPASLALISAAGLSVMKLSFFTHSSSLDYKALALAAFLFVLISRFKTHPVVFIAASALIGVILKF